MHLVASLSDNDLLALLQSGDQQAYIEIYDRYKHILQQHALKKLDDPQEVEDVLQDLFIYLWDKRESLVINTSLSGYLFTSIRNRIFNVYHKKQRESSYLGSLQEFIEHGEFSTDLLIREKELTELIEKEIDALPPRMKEVFQLSRNEGLTHKQIADLLGTSEQTVNKQIHNSLKLLRVRLGSMMVMLFF
jgi:RNA polymerase sigma-70 factor (family 1)